MDFLREDNERKELSYIHLVHSCSFLVTLPGNHAFVTFIFTGILLLDDLLLIVSERNQSFPPLPNGYYQAKGT